MRRLLRLSVFVAALGWYEAACHEALAQLQARPQMKLLEKVVSVVVLDEHRSITEDLAVFEALTPDGAQAMTTAPLRFESGRQTIQILDAYTLKQDGRRLPVTDDQIQKQVGQLGGSVGLTFPDLHTWQLKFNDVQVGDKTVLKYRIEQTHASLPSWHQSSWVANNDFDIDRLRVTLRAPTRLRWHVAVDGFKALRRDDGAEEVWEIEGAAPRAQLDAGAANVLTTVPHFVASTYHEPQAFGDAFAKAMFAKVAVTPEIASIANETTAGLTRREDVVQALYDWVRRNLRYSAVFLGAGAWVPRDLGDILAARSGDCKDLTLVLISLLKAKSIDATPALINLGLEYELLPTGIHQFNHVIVHVPESNLYLDPTSSHTPMGELPYAERGKPVVLARLQGSALARTPSLESSGNLVESVGEYEIDATGKLSGALNLHLLGNAAMNVQARLAQIPSESDGSLAARRMLEKARLQGQATMQFAKLDRDRARQDIAIRFDIDHFLASPEAGSMAPNPQLPFFGPYVKDNMGNYSASERRFVMPCAPITVRERFTIRFDPAYKLQRVPPAMEEQIDSVRYSATYRQEGQSIVGVREYVDSNPSMVCTPAQYKLRQPVMARILRNLASPIIYEQ